MKHKFLLTVIGLLMILSSGCKDTERTIVARVNGNKITVSDFRNELRIYHLGKTSTESLKHSERFLEIKKEILNAMIRDAILLEEAQKIGIQSNEKEISHKIDSIRKDYPGDSFSKFLIKNEINYNFWKKKIESSIIIEKITETVTKQVPKISENEIYEYYVKNKSRFTVPEQIKAYQIVVKKERDADRILSELKRKKDFEELAKEYSITPESENGGDMGYFSKGSMPEEFDKVLFRLRKGRTSRIVKSDFGFHIFKVVDKKPTRLKPLEEVSEEITLDLTNIKKDEIFSEWLKEKIANSKIERNNELLANIK